MRDYERISETRFLKRVSFNLGRPGFAFAAPEGLVLPVWLPDPPQANLLLRIELRQRFAPPAGGYLSLPSAPQLYPVLGVIVNDDVMFFFLTVDRSSKRRQVKPLAASLLEALDYDSSDDSDFKVGDASGKCFLLASLSPAFWS